MCVSSSSWNSCRLGSLSWAGGRAISLWNNFLSVDHPVCPRVLLRAQLSVLHHQPTFVKRLQPIKQRFTLTGFALDISTSATLSTTSLTHNSGTTFRSWVSIGLTGVVNAIPAGENADQRFDHCSFAVVPPSSPRRTHRFPVATTLSHWIVCSGCKTCMSFPLLS